MARKKLDEAELAEALLALPEWALENGEIVRTVSFDDFKQSMEFVTKVAELAEAANHHPDIDIRYNRVRLALVTHDSGGITHNDIEMAAKLDGVLVKHI